MSKKLEKKEEEKVNVQENIRKVIKEKGMKQKYVAEKAGFSEWDFSNMMNGKKIIRAEYIPVIAKAIGTDANTLLGIGE